MGQLKTAQHRGLRREPVLLALRKREWISDEAVKALKLSHRLLALKAMTPTLHADSVLLYRAFTSSALNLMVPPLSVISRCHVSYSFLLITTV